MKIFKTFPIICAAALAALASCSKEEDSPASGNDESWYAANASVSSDNSYFTATDGGGTIEFKSTGGEVTLNVSCGVDWTVENTDPSTFPAGWNVKAGTLTVSAGQNFQMSPRTATLTLRTSSAMIAFATIEIAQHAYGSPEISVDNNYWHAPAVGELSFDVAVTSSLGDFTAVSDAEWVGLDKTETGLTLTAGENTSFEAREAKVTLTASDGMDSDSVVITVEQDARAIVTPSVEGLTFDSFGGTVYFTVEANFDWEYSYEEGNGWFSAARDGDLMEVRVGQNDSDKAREGVIVLNCGDGAANTAEIQFPVTQAASDPELLVLEYTLTASGAAVQLPLDGTVGCTVSWGDGSTETVTSALPSHTYAEAGTYNVSVSGTVTSLCSSNVTASLSLLTRVLQWGTTGLSSMNRAFYKCDALISVPADTEGSFSKVTTFEDAFGYCTALTTADAGLLSHASKATSFNGTFYKCASLSEIPAGLFDACTAATDFYIVFDGCSVVPSIPEGLFDSCTNATDMGGMFFDCTSLASIPSGLFDHNTKVTDFSSLFYNCTSITSIPDGLFDYCPNVTSMQFLFHGTAITSIPSGLFDKCTKVTNFSDVFYSCGKLESIPDGLFDKCTKVTSLHGAFWDCSSLTAIPDGLFKNQTAVTDASYIFYGCSKIERIPDGLFDAFSKVTTFAQAFIYCTSLTYAPTDLFKNCTAATDFKFVFGDCYKLANIPTFSHCPAAETFYGALWGAAAETLPDGMFSGCTKVTSFYATFTSCFNLKSIPEDLFADCTAVTTFSGVFKSCTSLTSIPEGVFAGCTAATDFSYAFDGCTGLTSVPAGLFSKCTAATNLSYAFSLCTGLTSVPEGIFAANTKATTFADAFYGCISLTGVPSGLFANNPAVTSFYAAFYGCTGLTSVPADIFDSNLKVTNFEYTFCGCSNLSGESPYTTVDGVNVHLYERSAHTGTFSAPAAYTYCFNGCDSLSDISAIKTAGWY